MSTNDDKGSEETAPSSLISNNNYMSKLNRKRQQRVRAVETAVGVLAFALIIVCFFLYGAAAKRFNLLQASYAWLLQQQHTNTNTNNSSAHAIPVVEIKRCDLFEGEWVWDDSYPLYQSQNCNFIDGGFRCSENGRPDDKYTKWRWQPSGCNLPKFDAKLMLDKVLRDKRVVFVGDSIGRNQWESLLCMLSTGVSDPDKTIYEVNGSPITKHKGSLVFKFQEYNCSVEYYRSPFLVPQGRPPKQSPPNVRSSLKLDYMDWSSLNADVLIFNTGHWWNFEKTIRAGCYFEQGSQLKLNMSIGEAYKAALKTVFEWIHNNQLNSNNTRRRVFFRTYAPVHFTGANWKHGGTCHLDTLPDHFTGAAGSQPLPPETWPQFSILNDLLLSSQLGILNVTYMTSARKDGHLSLYYRDNKMGPTPIHRQDCSHWCLPGVPDTWNHLLYALLLP